MAIIFDRPYKFNELKFEEGDTDCCSHANWDLKSLDDTVFDKNCIIIGFEKVFGYGIRLVDSNLQRWGIACHYYDRTGWGQYDCEGLLITPNKKYVIEKEILNMEEL